MIKALLLCLILTGCASTQKMPHGVYEVKIIVTYNVENKCGAGNVGCIFCIKKKCNIYTTPERQCLAHEIDHLLYGAFHGKRKAECHEKPFIKK